MSALPRRDRAAGREGGQVAGPEHPNVALGACDAPNVAFGASDAPNVALGRCGPVGVAPDFPEWHHGLTWGFVVMGAMVVPN
ncbi:hypothetical protein CU254_05635 [Amycolatopsis sp. AA4]|nr:hypothetical protein CU254_05635 [Amycolatopsis sp. AA4]